MRLKLLIIPSRGSDDDIGEFFHKVRWGSFLISVLCRAVLNVAAAGVKERWMRLGNRDNVSAHVMRDRFDVARHRRRVRHIYFSRIDLALGGLINDGAEKMAAIGKVVR